jgi:hypothetical protein
MKDIEKLLRMTERPQDYSDEELEQLLSDPEMRDYYELIVKAEAGFAQKKRAKTHGFNHTMLLKIAATFVGVLLLSGIAYAAYHYAVRGDSQAPTQEVQMTNAPQQVVEHQQEPNVVRTFENAELQEILQELSDHYHVGVEFRNDQSRHIRLYTKWDTSAPLNLIIERLNGFEKVSIHVSNNHIIAE